MIRLQLRAVESSRVLLRSSLHLLTVKYCVQYFFKRKEGWLFPVMTVYDLCKRHCYLAQGNFFIISNNKQRYKQLLFTKIRRSTKLRLLCTHSCSVFVPVRDSHVLTQHSSNQLLASLIQLDVSFGFKHHNDHKQTGHPKKPRHHQQSQWL